MPRFHRTKIIATIGPAVAAPERMRELLAAGVDVLRLNFSHGDREQHRRLVETARAAEPSQRYVALLGDLSGPKLRITELPSDRLELEPGQRLTLRGAGEPAPASIAISEPGVLAEIQPGHRVLIDDGLIGLVARERSADGIRCEVVDGGRLQPRKGVNLPDTELSLPALTDKDRADLDWALELRLDWLALSFVRRAEDVEQLREAMRHHPSPPGVVAKIETPAAVRNIDAIIATADAILVARGDLGVELDPVELPGVQRHIVGRCVRAGRPVIVATQMLQSMIDEARPTRAEVSDVANAIMEGASAVMLSGETSVGHHPVAAAGFMRRIADRSDRRLLAEQAPLPELEPDSLRGLDAVARSAAQAARDYGARLLVCWTYTGTILSRLSKYQIGVPVVALSEDEAVCRRLALLSNVAALRLERPEDPRLMLEQTDRALVERGWAQPGDLMVILASTHRELPLAQNMIVLRELGASRLSDTDRA